MNSSSKKELFSILFIPFTFLILMWAVKIIEMNFKISFVQFGVFPQTASGLKGILFSPFIHRDFTHLINNSYPILILGGMLFAFYKKIAPQLLAWLFFISGFWLWIIGRPSFHIGASGIIYALASFLFVSGIIRKNPRLSAVSMVIIFLYGSMIWGVLPTKEGVSWEGHLAGMMAGIIVALFYKNEGPERKKYQWEIEEELEKERGENTEININYFYKEDD
ncbi:MAG: rhomboid family intramembrane serine protease [Flavobacteriales bacterium]|nr:rhomboid family intramembrane serine protease [Flavobacteriales bacterium]